MQAKVNRFGLVVMLMFLSGMAWVAPALGQNYTSTHSFTQSSVGSHPNTLTYGSGQVVVDLSVLPTNTQVYRAIFVTQRGGNSGSSLYDTYAAVQVEAADDPGNYLAFAEPRRVNLDCTAAVQRAVADAGQTLTLNVISFVNLGSGSLPLRVDVWCDEPAAGSVTQVTSLAAVHSNGDTRLTFTEVNSPLTATDVTLDQYYAAYNAMDNTNQVRYRIYRSTAPIDAVSIRSAELVDDIRALTCWNPGYYPAGQTGSDLTPRLAVTDLNIVAPQTGIYVHRASAAQNAYYAVSRAVDGQEDLSSFTSAHALTSSVAESTGTGAVVLQRVEHPSSFQYVDYPTLNYYVRWECPPTSSRPSQPFDYLVAEPNDAVSPRPVDLALHCWGGSLNGGYAWWYRAEDGALLVASNQIPYDWWTSYHENYGTANSFSVGKVYNYTQQRLESFVDNFVKQNFTVDNNRILLSGNSMGGAGASLYGMKNGDRFAYCVSWVGVHRPHMSPQFTGSFEGVYGKLAWDCPYYSNDMPVFDYEDMVTWLNDHPTVDTPYIAFSNGKNDSAIGWPQAVDYVNALLATKRPFNFKWGQSGHGERASQPGEGGSDRYIGIDITLNGPLPAFANCSLDQIIGNGDPVDGDLSGEINGYLYWDTATVVDLSNQFQMTCKLESGAPQANCTVDMTPRRAASFVLSSGTNCTWTNTDQVTMQQVQSGNATADTNGLVTVTGLVVSKNGNRVVITAGGVPPDTTPPADITDLAAGSPTETSIQLSWTAPGDDGSSGTASSYDVRYSTSSIDAGNWASATQATGEPSPLVAGTPQSTTVSGLGAGTTYYFAMKTSDEVPNESGLSNAPSATTSSTGPGGETIELTQYMELQLDDGTDPNATFYFGVASDPHIYLYGWNDAQLQAVLEDWVAVGAAFGVITGDLGTGDNAQPDGAGTTNQTDKFAQTIAAVANCPPVAIAMGNHETDGDGKKSWLDAIYPGVVSGVTGDGNEQVFYYSFDYHNCHFICLDATVKVGGTFPYDGELPEAELDWLEQDLALNVGEPTFIFVHQPSEQINYDTPFYLLKNRGRVIALMEQYPDAQWIFHGHLHYRDQVNSWGLNIVHCNMNTVVVGVDNGVASLYEVDVNDNLVPVSSWYDLDAIYNARLNLEGSDYVYRIAEDALESAGREDTLGAETSLIIGPDGGVSPVYGGNMVKVLTTLTARDTNSFTNLYRHLSTDVIQIQGGMVFSYDVQFDPASVYDNFALELQLNTPNGEPRPVLYDQNSVLMDRVGTYESPELGGLADGVWYHRTVDLSSLAGGAVVGINLYAIRPNGAPYPAGDLKFYIDNIAFTYPGGASDTTAPAAVTDLAAGNPTSGSIQLTWTAPGDDGSTGTASSYDVRYSMSLIDAGNWASATQATGEPAPQVAGSAESFIVTGLSAETTYYFAIKTSDEVPNESALSNVPSAATSAAPSDTTPPDDVTDLSVSNVASTTVWLTWTASGDDGSTGTATSYDVRYSTSPIDAGNWASASQATGEPAPQVAGSTETFVLSGLSETTTYYFAVKTSDEVPNESGLS
ncbi:MAG TPA: fibronectin type III domain-containing protein, partial [Phycisphaerae bacterium]|nr:fibronectin type III domain-containing protein [Phycisphaerae bacterium]